MSTPRATIDARSMVNTSQICVEDWSLHPPFHARHQRPCRDKGGGFSPPIPRISWQPTRPVAVPVVVVPLERKRPRRRAARHQYSSFPSSSAPYQPGDTLISDWSKCPHGISHSTITSSSKLYSRSKLPSPRNHPPCAKRGTRRRQRTSSSCPWNNFLSARRLACVLPRTRLGPILRSCILRDCQPHPQTHPTPEPPESQITRHFPPCPPFNWISTSSRPRPSDQVGVECSHRYGRERMA